MTAIGQDGTYELLLRFSDGREELRLGDQLARFTHGDDSLMLHGQLWRIVGEQPAALPGAVSRLICERVPLGATATVP